MVEDKHRVRPTSGLEFVHSSHFPDEVQGDLLINNTIGFLGMKQHSIVDDETGYESKHRHDLVKSSDPHFRPVDMEFAPDGSLYLLDWHNVLIGHMQHNARDPLRDHVHGRVYRVTYPSRPLVTPPKVVDASISELLNNLKLPEYRARYRSRRELRGRPTNEVLAALKTWLAALEKEDLRYTHHRLEGLWVTWGLNQIDGELLRQLLADEDPRARAAAVRVLRYAGHQIKDQPALLMIAAQDDHGRVRMEAFIAASWLRPEQGTPIIIEAGKKPLDEWMLKPYEKVLANMNHGEIEPEAEEKVETALTGEDRELYVRGKAIYTREGYCITCHQENGKGLESSGYPPLQGTSWALGDEERLIKVTLNGLMGPLEIDGKHYEGQVPMMPFGGILNDEEIAAVLTYVRNSFDNKASVISPETVKTVREATKEKKGFYTAEELK